MLSGRIKRWTGRAHQRVGAKIREAALRDMHAGRVGEVSFSTRIAQGLAGVIVALPFVLMAAGIAIMAADFPNLLYIVLGAMSLGMGIYVRPRRWRLEGAFKGREDMPEMFALCDEITQRLGGKPITKVQLKSELNAYSIDAAGERVLGMGVALWLVLSPQERVAVIAHEVSHQVNGDQARRGVLHTGLQSLERWYFLFGNSHVVDHEGYYIREHGIEDAIGGGIMAVIATGIEWVWLLLSRLSFLDSQRAEYLADGIAARAGGIKAGQSTLRKLCYAPLLEKAAREMAPARIPSGTAYFEQLCRQLIEAAPKQRAALEASCKAEGHCVDVSHPPTFERISFLEQLSKPPEAPVAYRDGLDAEMAPYIEEIGAEMLLCLEVQ